ncbi:imidazole glycerol phosphate synthase subunit HisH [Pelagibacteraceae bacterium]|nr:imidazole glycerol phosphate synthase subunit HisH [Pelagibacteraceae bacterium]
MYVTVIDLGIGNLMSIIRGLEHWGANVKVTSDPKIILKSSHVVLPGDGAFNYAMEQIKKKNLLEAIKSFSKSKSNLLGICIGMQILFDQSNEFKKTEGLGLISGKVVSIPNKTTGGKKLVLPHIGWNSLLATDHFKSWGKTLLENNKTMDEMYFIHSYMAVPDDHTNRVADCVYGGHKISAVVMKNNITGCQFHPEKSGQLGLKILKKFVEKK